MILRDRDTSSPANGTLNERLYSLCDANFNVVALADTAGDIQERYSYNAYGKCQVLTPAFADRASSSYDWQYRFTGRRLDTETGLMYYRNRYHHPNLGRFINRDPIGYEGKDANLYRYLNNQPTAATDPKGLEGNWERFLECYSKSDYLGMPLPTSPPSKSKGWKWWPWGDDAKDDAVSACSACVGAGAPLGGSEAAGALACVAEALQADKQEAYYLRQMRCYEGISGAMPGYEKEYARWEGILARCREMRKNAKAKKKCPSK